MNRLIISAVSLSMSLGSVAGVAMAQEKDVQGIATNADGAYVTSTAGLNPTANGEGGTIIYGDITTGPGYTEIGPPSVVQNGTSPDPVLINAPEPAPAPVAETVVAEPVAADTAAATDTAVATETDLDADNYADALEWELGLDPNNADTDGDGTADGDELNIYGTDPTVYDTDGDGISDGEELFGIQTDPLTWNDFSTDGSAAVAQETAVAAEEPIAAPAESVAPLAQGTTENLTATDGNAAARGPGSASASPGSVTRGSSSGMSLLGPDGTYSVTEVAPPNVTVAGDTEVLSPAPVVADNTSVSTVAGCESYASWYDAQVAYEAAGMTSADPAIVSALDPDYDGIVCEEGM